MIQRIAIDTTRDEPLREPGLSAPDQRAAYTLGEVQELVRAAFGEMLPWVRTSFGGPHYYENFDEESRETCSLSRHPESVAAVPAEEIVRLSEGMARLRRLSLDPSVSAPARRIAQGFQLPNPATDLDRYRLYRDSQGRTRLHVLWGFARAGQRGSAVAAEEAILQLGGEVRRESTLSRLTRSIRRMIPNPAAAGPQPLPALRVVVRADRRPRDVGEWFDAFLPGLRQSLRTVASRCLHFLSPARLAPCLGRLRRHLRPPGFLVSATKTTFHSAHITPGILQNGRWMGIQKVVKSWLE